MGEVTLGSDLLQSSAAVKADVLKMFDRNEESLRRDIENIKEWFKKQPHLPETPSDQLIQKYLFMTKFRIEIAKTKLDNYYSVRSIVPELFDKDPNGPELQKAMDVVYQFPLPKLTKDHYRVILMKLRDPNPDNFNIVNHTAFVYAIFEIMAREDCRLGEIQIYDLEGLKLSHAAQFNPMFMKRADFVLKRILVARLVALHFINAPPILDTILSYIKGFFSKKQSERIFVHKTPISLQEIVGKEVLPIDYGGDEMSLEELHAKWKQKFRDYDDVFKHLRSLKVNEELRPGKPLDHDLQGVQGNFRRLDID